MKLGGLVLALTLACLCEGGCYEPTPFRVSVRTPATAVDCARIADGVFRELSYRPAPHVSGPDLFYTPQMGWCSPGLGWGVAVWIKKEGSAAGPCEYELENLQAGPVCSYTQCVYVPQRGAEFDDGLKDLARRLAVAAR